MASPDISSFVDPTIYDVQPADVYDASVEYARAALPEWTPTPGSIEDALLQSAAGVSGELLGALNRTTSSITEALLKLFGIERLSGTKPTATLRVRLSDELGHTLRKGTRFGWLDTSGTDPILYAFESTQDVTAVRLQDEIEVPVEGILNERYPLLEEGTPIRLLSGVSWIETVVLDDDLDPGLDPETDEQYFTRAIGKLASFTEALVLPHQFDQHLLATYRDVFRSKAFSRLDPTNDLIAETLPKNGYLTIYACGLGGASLTPEKTAAMEADLTQRAVAGLEINILPPHLVPIEVATTIICRAGFNATTVTREVKATLERYLTPDFWLWGDTIYYNEVVSLINSVTGVARVEDLSLYCGVDGATEPVGTFDLGFARYGSLPVLTAIVTARAVT